MSNGYNLSSHIVVESVDTIGVDETVSNPQASAHCLFYLIQNLKPI